MEALLVHDRSKLKISFQRQPPRLVRWGFHPSPFNSLMIGLTPDGAICRVDFARGRKPEVILKEWQKAWPKTEFTKDEIATATVLKKVSGNGAWPEIVITGTPFQQSVWKAMMKIPAGKALSYAEVAKKIGNPKAVRAVGTACGANPVALLVPCHRIIGSNGGLGGFGGGLPMKRMLLEAEGVLKAA